MKRWFQSKTINTPSPIGALLSYLVLGVWAFLIIFPLYWLVITSFKISSQVAEGPFYLPFVDFKPSLDAWKYILVGDLSNDTLRNFTNTIIVAPLSALIASSSAPPLPMPSFGLNIVREWVILHSSVAWY
jgi:multiple sugar transport system permease protein